MKNKSWVLFGLFCVFIIQSIDIQAQKIQKNISITWKDNLKYHYSEENFMEFLQFDGYAYFRSEDHLPVFYEKIPVDIFSSEFDVKTSNIQYGSLRSGRGDPDRGPVPAPALGRRGLWRDPDRPDDHEARP